MTKQPAHATHLYPEGWTDYRLVDRGEGLKLEQFGPYRFIRPEPQALWAKFLPDSEWTCADGVFLPGGTEDRGCLLYTSPSPRDYAASRMPSSA